MADCILYAGLDLEHKIITTRFVPKFYLPNPIDINHFYRRKLQVKKKGLTIVSGNLAKEDIIKRILDKDTDIVDLDKQQIPYSMMPNFLSQYTMYYDVKVTDDGRFLHDLSTTGLQALACGLSVYHENTVLTDLPDSHRPEMVTKKLYEIYSQIIHR